MSNSHYYLNLNEFPSPFAKNNFGCHTANNGAKEEEEIANQGNPKGPAKILLKLND
jgi:hypothetical protein